MAISNKETPRVIDSIIMEGGTRGAKRGGLQSSDGKPLDPEIVAKNFGVSVEDAKEIIRRLQVC